MEHEAREVTFPMECKAPARASEMAATVMSLHSAWSATGIRKRTGEAATWRENCKQTSAPGAKRHLGRELSAT